MTIRDAWGSVTIYDILDGIDGNDGSNGTDGVRGNRHFYVVGNSWSDQTATDHITLTEGLSLVEWDVVTIYNDATGFSETQYWDGDSWEPLAQVIDGNLIVDGTVRADQIDVDDLFSENISADGTITVGDTSSQAVILSGISNTSPIEIYGSYVESVDSNGAITYAQGRSLYLDSSTNELVLNGGLGYGSIKSINAFTPEVRAQLMPQISGASGGEWDGPEHAVNGATTLTSTVNLTNINSNNILLSLGLSDGNAGTNSGLEWNIVVTADVAGAGSPTEIYSKSFYARGSTYSWYISAKVNESIDISHIATEGDVDIVITATLVTGNSSTPRLHSITISQVRVGGVIDGNADQLNFQPGTYYLDYNNFTNVPSSFTPSAHTHVITDVTGLQTALDGKLSTSGTAPKVTVSNHTANNVEYPLVWHNNSNSLYDTVSKLTFNPSVGRVSATTFKTNGSSTTLTDGSTIGMSAGVASASTKLVTPKLVFLNDADGDDNYITANDVNTTHSINGQQMGAWFEFVGDKTAATSDNSAGIVASGLLTKQIEAVNVKTTSHIQSGVGSGGVALTINDGYGNANVTFNHLLGIPEQDGNAFRIETNTDSTTNACMYFELKSGVTGGVTTALTGSFRIYENYLAVGSTGIKFVDSNGGLFENGININTKYLGIDAKAADSELLDGYDSSAFGRRATDSTWTAEQRFSSVQLGTHVPTRILFNDEATGFDSTAGRRNYFAPRKEDNSDWHWTREFGFDHSIDSWYFDVQLKINNNGQHIVYHEGNLDSIDVQWTGDHKFLVDGSEGTQFGSASYNALVGISSMTNEYLFGGSDSSARIFDHYIRVGADKLQFTSTQGTNWNVALLEKDQSWTGEQTFNNHVYFNPVGYNFRIEKDSATRTSFQWLSEGESHWNLQHNTNGNLDFITDNASRHFVITNTQDSGSKETLTVRTTADRDAGIAIKNSVAGWYNWIDGAGYDSLNWSIANSGVDNDLMRLERNGTLNLKAGAGGTGIKLKTITDGASDYTPFIHWENGSYTHRQRMAYNGGMQWLNDSAQTMVLTQDGQLIISRISSPTIGGTNLDNSHLLVGSTSYGIGIDANEIVNKGADLHIGTVDDKDIYIRRHGKLKLYLYKDYATLYGESTGNSNVSYLRFAQSDGTLDGYIGIANNSNRNMHLYAYGGPMYLNALSGIYLQHNSSSKLNTTNDGIHISGKQTLKYDDTESNVSQQAVYIDYNCSGTQTHTTDNTHRGLYIDVDSEATGGDSDNEHRLYGVEVDLRFTGTSDLAVAGRFVSRTNHTDISTASVYGIQAYGYAQHYGTSHVNNVVGSVNLAQVNTTCEGTITTVYGTQSKALLASTVGAVTSNAYGLSAEVELDAGTVGDVFGVRSLVDSDGGTITGDTYLFKGEFQGGIPSGSYGVYINHNVPNFFAGSLDAKELLEDGELISNSYIRLEDLSVNADELDKKQKLVVAIMEQFEAEKAAGNFEGYSSTMSTAAVGFLNSAFGQFNILASDKQITNYINAKAIDTVSLAAETAKIQNISTAGITITDIQGGNLVSGKFRAEQNDGSLWSGGGTVDLPEHLQDEGLGFTKAFRTGSRDAVYHDQIAIAPGETIYVSMWVNTEDLDFDDGSDNFIALGCRWYDGGVEQSNWTWSEDREMTKGKGWTYIESKFTNNSSTYDSFQPYIHINAWDNNTSPKIQGYAYVQDVVFTRTPFAKYKTEGEVAGWKIDTGHIWSGTKQETDGQYTAEGITLSAEGALRTKNFRIDNDGAVWGRGFSISASGDASFAGHVEANSGTIGGLNVDSQYLWHGTKHASNSFTPNAGDFTMNLNGAIRSNNFRIDNDGSAFFRGDISGAFGTFSEGIKVGNSELASVAPSDMWAHFTLDDVSSNGLVDSKSNASTKSLNASISYGIGLDGTECLISESDTAGQELLTDSEVDTVLANEYTIALWFKSKAESQVQTQTRLISRDYSDFWAVLVDQSDAENQSIQYGRIGNTSTGNIVTEKWYHLAITCSKENNYVRFYLDGELQHEHVFLDSARATPIALFGNVEDVIQNSYGFFGSIDDIRVFDRPITDGECKALHDTRSGSAATQSSKTSGLVGGWNVDKDYIWSGELKNSSGYTNSGITLSATGALRSKYFRIEEDGSVYGSGFSIDSLGDASFSGDITGSTITGSTLSTANSGTRVELTTNDVRFYDSTGTDHFTVDASSSVLRFNSSLASSYISYRANGSEYMNIQGYVTGGQGVARFFGGTSGSMFLAHDENFTTINGPMHSAYLKLGNSGDIALSGDTLVIDAPTALTVNDKATFVDGATFDNRATVFLTPSYSSLTGMGYNTAAVVVAHDTDHARADGTRYIPSFESWNKADNGYRQHLAIGHKRSVSGWDDIFIAVGGNDAYNTKEILIGANTGDMTLPNDLLVTRAMTAPTIIAGSEYKIGSMTLTESTHRGGLLRISDTTTTWSGIQIGNATEDLWNFMADGGTCGIYNDTTNEWAFSCDKDGGTHIRFNGSTKIATNSTGIGVSGDVDASGSLFSEGISNHSSTTATNLPVINSTRGGNILLVARNNSDGFYYGLRVVSGSNVYGRVDYNSNERMIATSAGITVTGTGTATDWSATSDSRVKYSIDDIVNAREKLREINGKTFYRKDGDELLYGGTIAQDWEKVFSPAVREVEDEELGTKKVVQTQGQIGLIVAATNEIDDEVSSLRKEVDELKQLVKQLMEK